MQTWQDAHDEYERLSQARRYHRGVMEALGRQAVRAFEMYGASYETREHPAYLRYKAAWKKRARYIDQVIRPQLKLIRETWG